MSKFFITLLFITLGVINNTHLLGQVGFCGGIQIGYGGYYPPVHNYPPHCHTCGNTTPTYQNWSPPVCDNAGNSLGRVQAMGYHPQLVSFPIDMYDYSSLATGCIVDGQYTMAGSTVNMVVNGMPRSIPISNQARQVLERGGTIQVTVIW